MNIDRRLLGWGAFFILAGAIALAVRTGVLDEGFVSRWPSLWPLLLIAWGLGLLLRRTPVEWVGGAVLVTTFGLMAGGALATGFGGVGCTGDAPGTAFEAQRGSFEAPGQLNVQFNCGTLAMAAVSGAEWSVSGTESGGRAPRVTTSGATVSIEGAADGGLFEDGGEAHWTVAVPTTSTLGLGITLNAGDGTADLPGASLTSVNLTVNAGAFRLGLTRAERLGDVNATVNAGNVAVDLPSGDRSVNVSLNAGNLDVCLPAGTPVRVHWSGALGSNDLDEAGLEEVGEDTWVSAGFVETQPHVELNVSANAGSFGLDLQGTCGA